MIVCRHPIRLFDVDLAGLVGLVVLAAIGAWRLPAEWDRVSREYQQRGTLYRGVDAQLRAEMPAVAERESRVAEALEALRTRQASVPTTRALPDLLRDLAGTVDAAGLELVRLTPQPLVREGAYDVCDIEFAARGSIVDLIRFLDQLSQRLSCHELRACQVSRNAAGACELSWRLRLRLLPPPVPKSGATP